MGAIVRRFTRCDDPFPSVVEFMASTLLTVHAIVLTARMIGGLNTQSVCEDEAIVDIELTEKTDVLFFLK